LNESINVSRLQAKDLELSIELKKAAIEKSSVDSSVKSQTLKAKLSLLNGNLE